MSRKTNIKAFTLLETLITVMLISVIIALSYGLVNLIGKQLHLFEKENTQVLDYSLFNSTLISDTYNATSFQSNANHLRLDYFDNTSIHYYINDKVILREFKERSDTFRIEAIDYSFRKSSTNKYSKDYLHIRLKLLNDTIRTNYYLKRSNAETINSKIFNEN